jgi:3-oxoacyl-[acyl-carrier protein] reductase
MTKASFGSIVNMCSIASFGGQEGRANYAASKAGLMALTWVMAQELAAYNIRVNAVAPALIGTEMIKRGVPQDFLRDVILDRKPLARLGTPEEVADAVLFLLSERASYINGEVLKVDGGLLSGYFCSNQRIGQSFKRKT